MKKSIFLILFLLLPSISVPVPSPSGLIADFKVIREDIQQLRAELDELKAAVSASILITQRSCEELGSNWKKYQEGAGKFLIGASAKYPASTHGGVSSNTLQIPNMPPHSHGMLWGQYAGTGRQVSGGDLKPKNKLKAIQIHNTEKAGSGKSFSNIPPYRAVNFCIHK